MQDIEPFPVPLYVLALARPAFTSDCDDAMRWSPAASRARPFNFSGCSVVWCMLIGGCAVFVGTAIACTDSADELAMVVSKMVQEMAQSGQAVHW
jgi:hypothetical protein